VGYGTIRFQTKMNKKLRVASINFPFSEHTVDYLALDSDRALFDFDVVVIRPSEFGGIEGKRSTYEHLNSVMQMKRKELKILLAQGGILVIIIDVPDYYSAEFSHNRNTYTVSVNNYDFLDGDLASFLEKGTGNQISYSSAAEPFIGVLKKSTVAWTAYITRMPDTDLRPLKFFAHTGRAGALAGKMAYDEGHLILLPNLHHLDEKTFFEACAEYRFKRQGTAPPDWAGKVLIPGLEPIETAIADLDRRIGDLQNERQLRNVELEGTTAYRKLLYEKGKAQLEPIVLRALDHLDFGTSPGEVIAGTIHEIDGRTSNGSKTGVVEVKGSKNQIAQSEFSPFVTKILADAEVSKKYSKGLLVGNGLCETEPRTRLGDSIFSQHVLVGAKLNSVALVNSVELCWLICALLRGDSVDKNAVREVILTGNGYVDLKPFSGKPPF
jgi:hypothetical protein